MTPKVSNTNGADPMMTIVVLTFQPEKPDDITEILSAIDPSRLPHFAGQARISIGADAKAVVDWLDDQIEDLPT